MTEASQFQPGRGESKRVRLAGRPAGDPASQFLNGSLSIGSLLFAILMVIFLAVPAVGLPGQPAAGGINPSNFQLPRLLKPGAEARFALPAHTGAASSFPLAVGQYADISIEQLDGLLQATLTDPSGKTHTPVTLDAGRTSIIRLPVIADLAGSYSVDIECRVPLRGMCSGTISISAPEPATAREQEILRARGLLAQAEWSRRKGDRRSWPGAVREYDQVIQLAKSLGDRELLRAALTGKARILVFELNKYKAGLEAAVRAAAISPATSNLAGQALAWKTLAAAQYFAGDYSASIEAGNRALALYRSTSDEYWQGIVLGNLAYKFKETGQTDEGLEAASSALKIARAIGDGYGIDFDLETSAALHLERGEVQTAFEIYHQALDALRMQPYPYEAGAVWNGLGQLYSELHDAARARDALDKALAFSIKAHDTSGELLVLNNLGNLFLREQYPAKALSYFRRGAERAQSLGLAPEQSFFLTGLGRAYTYTMQRDKALASYQKAIALAREISQRDSEALAWQGLGDLEAESGHRSQAAQAYRKSLQFWQGERNLGRMAVALASLARLDYRGGQLAPALDQIEKALGLIESSRATLASRELRTSYFASSYDYYELAIAILERLNQLYPDRGYDAQAYEMAERAKARTLLDSLEGTPVAQAEGVPAQLATRQRRIREQLDAAYARLADVNGSAPTTPRAMQQLHRRIEELLRQSDDTEAQMRSTSARYDVLARGEPAQLTQIETQLGAHTALLEYSVGKSESYLWVLSSHHVRTYTLPRASDLRSQVDQFRAALLARARNPPGEGLAARHMRVAAADIRCEREAFALGHLLLEPALNLPGIRTLVIVPAGPMWMLPFAALRLPAPASNDRTARVLTEYAVARFRIVEEPSASVLLSLIGRRHPGKRPLRVAIFADPVYNTSDARVQGHIVLAKSDSSSAPPANNATWDSEAGMEHLPRLDGSEKEALGITRLAGPKNVALYAGFAAQPEAVWRTDWSRYAIAHFAAHAIVNPDHPAFSGIVLSMVNRRGHREDGVLWLSEIYSLKMPVSLVVLSGCGTAAGQQIPGEGIAGLSRAFFYAGAGRVVGSLWSVEDQQTSALMRNFYYGLLKRNLSAAEALRAAQLQMARTGQWQAPYFWAGFVLQGLPD